MKSAVQPPFSFADDELELWREVIMRKHKHFSYWRGIAGLVSLVLFMGVIALVSQPGASNAAANNEVAVTKEAASQKDFTASMEQRLGKVGAEIDQLKERMRSSSDSLQSDLQARLTQLEKQKQDLATRLEQARHSTGQAFNQLRSGIENAWTELKKGVQSASSELNQKSHH